MPADSRPISGPSDCNSCIGFGSFESMHSDVGVITVTEWTHCSTGFDLWTVEEAKQDFMAWFSFPLVDEYG